MAGCRLSHTFFGRVEVPCLMHRPLMFPLVAILATCVPTPVLAQRLPFERTFELSAPAILDVSTIRGQSGRVSPQGRPASWARRSKDPHRTKRGRHHSRRRSARACHQPQRRRSHHRRLGRPFASCMSHRCRAELRPRGSSTARPLSVDRPRTVVPYSPSERLTSPCDRCDDLSDTRRTEALQEAVRARPHA